MGQSAAETVKEIEDTRDRLERDIDELAEKLPSVSPWARRVARIALSGGLGSAAFWYLAKRVRRGGPRQAIDAVVEPVEVTVQLVPERWVQALGSDRGKAIVLTAGSVWLVLKLLELRRLRRLQEAIVGAR